jgi:hypothetical protein
MKKKAVFEVVSDDCNRNLDGNGPGTGVVTAIEEDRVQQHTDLDVTTTPALGPIPSRFRLESSATTSNTPNLHSWSSPRHSCEVQPC